MKQASQLLLISFGCLSISACSSTQLVSYSIIQQSNQCHIQAPTITNISSQEEQMKFIEKYSLFKTPDSKQDLTNLFKEHSQDESLFIVAQGSKPSSGYGFKINGLTAKLDGEQLTLPIMFTSPKQGSFLLHK